MMVPGSHPTEPLWSVVVGLLLAAVLGGGGMGLLFCAAWRWLVARARALPGGINEVGGSRPKASPHLRPEHARPV